MLFPAELHLFTGRSPCFGPAPSVRLKAWINRSTDQPQSKVQIPWKNTARDSPARKLQTLQANLPVTGHSWNSSFAPWQSLVIGELAVAPAFRGLSFLSVGPMFKGAKIHQKKLKLAGFIPIPCMFQSHRTSLTVPWVPCDSHPWILVSCADRIWRNDRSRSQRPRRKLLQPFWAA